MKALAAAAAAAAVVAAVSPASAEQIRTYWRLEAATGDGHRTVGPGTPILVDKLLPQRLVRLKQPAVPAGADRAVAADTLLYVVVNAMGETGYCTLKDRSGGRQARTLFIPIADQRPCFVDRDRDGRFDASFSVYEPDTSLSPPQARGSISNAKAMAAPAAYEQVDVHAYPESMTLSYSLIRRGTLAKSWLRAKLERPGHSDEKDLTGTAVGSGVRFEPLGALVTVRSAEAETAEVDILLAPGRFVYGSGSTTEFVLSPPRIPALEN